MNQTFHELLLLHLMFMDIITFKVAFCCLDHSLSTCVQRKKNIGSIIEMYEKVGNSIFLLTDLDVMLFGLNKVCELWNMTCV